MKNKLQTETILCKNGYQFTIQKMEQVSHLIILDKNIYPDTDSRSKDFWRWSGLLIPINDDNDFNELIKMFKKFKNENKQKEISST